MRVRRWGAALPLALVLVLVLVGGAAPLPGPDLVRLHPAEAASAVPLVRINAGGPRLTGSPPWAIDSAVRPSPNGDANLLGPPAITATTAPIATTDPSIPRGTPAALFADVRADPSGLEPDLSYVLHVPAPGRYTVRLYFVELVGSYTGSNSRVLDVVIDDVVRDAGLDVARRAGGTHRGFARTYVVDTTSVGVQVELRRVRQTPAIAALELVGVPPVTPDLPGAWTRPVGGAPRFGEHAFVALGGFVYRGGGQILVGYRRVRSTTRHDRWNPRSGTWESLPPLPVEVDHVQGVVHGGQVWYLGGMTGGPGTGVARQASGQVVSYDPARRTFTSHAPMPRPRGAGGVAVVGDRIYYFGGLTTPKTASRWADVYDIAADRWSTLPDLPAPKDHLKAAALGTDIHLPGGRNGTAESVTARHDVFDTRTRTYRTAAPVPVPVAGFGLGVLDRTLVLAGGELRDPDAARSDTFRYHPLEDRWSRVEGMHIPRHGIDLAACGNALYLAAGMADFGAANTHDSVEVFTADGSPPSCPATAHLRPRRAAEPPVRT